jgi:hypothetical protein
VTDATIEPASQPAVEPAPQAAVEPAPQPQIIRPVPDTVAVASRRVVARALMTLVLFAASVALGVGLHVGSHPQTPHVERFPTITNGAAEPHVSAEIATAIVGKNTHMLASKYSAELLQAYQQAMAPVVDAEDIRYVGGVERDGETLASYVVTGQTAQGIALISGFVVHVRDGEITGFN